jgi:hypothetical protein
MALRYHRRTRGSYSHFFRTWIVAPLVAIGVLISAISHIRSAGFHTGLCNGDEYQTPAAAVSSGQRLSNFCKGLIRQRVAQMETSLTRNTPWRPAHFKVMEATPNYFSKSAQSRNSPHPQYRHAAMHTHSKAHASPVWSRPPPGRYKISGKSLLLKIAAS